MEVAVSVDSLHLVTLAQSEADNGLLTGGENLALVALLGLQGDPLDVMLREHGMRCGADLDGYKIAFHLIDRNVLLCGGFCCSGDDLLHFLPTAHDRDTRVFDFGNDVAAVLTNIKFLFHFKLPPLNCIMNWIS